MTKKRILVAPLDWGLGHAARCIPLIRYLLEKKCTVLIGAGGRAMELLKNEPTCKEAEFIQLPGYTVSYPRNGSMVLKMATQVPRILKGISLEHEQLKKLITEKKIDAVISDNRFGLWSKKVPCVFITHQLMVKSPLGENFIRKKNTEYISRFSECWVPDIPNGLSGDLGGKFKLPPNAKYIGLLSRFDYPQDALPEKRLRELLVILSGPEPQRTIFEKMILQQLPRGLKALIVQGITEKKERIQISEDAELVSHLTAEELRRDILSSEMILSRPGYSTLMDLAVLGKKAVFVPTPRQTEQEYLAEQLMKNKIAYSVSQKKFALRDALKEARNYSGFIESYPADEFKKHADRFILSLR